MVGGEANKIPPWMRPEVDLDKDPAADRNVNSDDDQGLTLSSKIS